MNNQWGLLVEGLQVACENCSFASDGGGLAAVPYVNQGGNASCRMSNVCFFCPGFVELAFPYTPAQLPGMWLKGSNKASEGVPAGFIMDGSNSFCGRGILLDGTYSSGDASRYYLNCIENQQPTTPFVMTYGANTFFPVEVKYCTMDSEGGAAIGNWNTGGFRSVRVIDVGTFQFTPLITGFVIPGLVLGTLNGNPTGQNISFFQELEFGTYNSTAMGSPSQFSAGQTIINQPLQLGLGPAQFPAFFPLQIGPTNITAVQSASVGTFPAGSQYYFGVSVRLLNGGGTATGLDVTTSDWAGPVTLDGTHAVDIAWTGVAASIGKRGYDVWYWNKANGLIGRLNNSPIAATSTTQPTPLSFGTPTTLDGAGWPIFASEAIYTPLVRFGNAYFKADLGPTTLTADQAYTLPNATGNVVVNAGSGIGNGASGNVTALAKGTGTGPATPGTVAGFIQHIDPTLGTIWIPYMV